RRSVPASRERAAPRKPPRPAPRRPAGPPRLGNPRRRLRVATVLALTMFAVIGLRLIALQVTDAPAYAKEGLETRLRPVQLPAPRGAILDRDGNVLAHSVDARFIYVDPTQVKDPEHVAEVLSPLLGMAKSDLLPKIKPHKRPGGGAAQFEYLRRGVDVDRANRILALNLPGIYAGRDERRDVPGHDLAANLIGFTGTGMLGLEGMEARYDDVLRGVDGKLVYEVGRGDLNAEIPGGYRKETPAQPGRSMRLTVDRDLQFLTQQTLTQQLKQVRAEFGAAVVLDVRTGEVVAQASYPTYNAADWQKYDPSRERVDVASSVVVDPGSVHKALTIGAALDAGVITPDTEFTMTAPVTKGDAVYRDTHYHPPGTKIKLPELLAFSSNLGTIQIADRLGADKLYEYQREFGLGAPTGEGVPGEAAGLVQPPKNWSGSSYGSIPIGHGVSTTLIQMAAVFATIANDGKYVQPHLVQALLNQDGSTNKVTQPTTRQVISPTAARELRLAMEAVTTVPNATGITGAIRGYRVAAKTGTGKRVVNGKYVGGDVASFIGMAPAENPRYVVAVMAYTPGGGGAICGPAFREVMAATLAHYKVPPTGTRPPKFELSKW
uniref:peptidoglycan D,D-transpeptidase FtsI family protein n=1 Tax=Rhizomonospora bruguierae TaxID=1581705 RepID=UPI001BCC656F